MPVRTMSPSFQTNIIIEYLLHLAKENNYSETGFIVGEHKPIFIENIQLATNINARSSHNFQLIPTLAKEFIKSKCHIHQADPNFDVILVRKGKLISNSYMTYSCFKVLSYKHEEDAMEKICQISNQLPSELSAEILRLVEVQCQQDLSKIYASLTKEHSSANILESISPVLPETSLLVCQICTLICIQPLPQMINL
jgi:hypothetical protein